MCIKLRKKYLIFFVRSGKQDEQKARCNLNWFFFGLVELDALVSELMHTIFWGEGGLSLENLLPNIRTIKEC